MNLKQRMQHQNKNNSSIINNSNFDFGQLSKQDQIYDKSRRQCEQQMVKRKNELEYQRANLLKVKEKELNNSLQKFNNDFEDVRKQIINMINQHLTETKARMMAQIKEKKSVDTNEEIYIKKQIQEMLARINANLIGQYREYIAKIVITDFDTSKEEIKQAIRKIKYPLPNTFVDEKTYNCFRADLGKLVNLSFNTKPEYSEGPAKDSASEYLSVNLHQNRDKLKRGG